MSLLLLLGPSTPSSSAQGYRSFLAFYLGGANVVNVSATTWPGYIAPFGWK